MNLYLVCSFNEMYWGLCIILPFVTHLVTLPLICDMIIPATYLASWKHIHDNNTKNVLYHNAHENRPSLPCDDKVCDQVYLINKDIKSKFAPTKLGPLCIVKVHTNATVTIQRKTNVCQYFSSPSLFGACLPAFCFFFFAWRKRVSCVIFCAL